MSGEDWLHSQGRHCKECFAALEFDEHGYWCALHPENYGHIPSLAPLFDPLLQLEDLEEGEAHG